MVALKLSFRQMVQHLLRSSLLLKQYSFVPVPVSQTYKSLFYLMLVHPVNIKRKFNGNVIKMLFDCKGSRINKKTNINVITWCKHKEHKVMRDKIKKNIKIACFC